MEAGFELRKALGAQYVLDLLSPSSPYGAELVRRPRLYGPDERDTLAAEWANAQAVVDALDAQRPRFDRMKRLFMQVRDIRGTLARCRETALSEVELFEVKRFLLQLALIAPLYDEMNLGLSGIAFTEESEALALLDPDGRRAAGFSISAAYSGPLAEARDAKAKAERALRDTPEGPARAALLAERRALVVQEEEEALKVRVRLSEALRPHLNALLQNTRMIGKLDFLLQRAELAAARGAVRPLLSAGGVKFTGLRNPQVEDALASRGQAFTPVTIEAPPGATVITGANMGGKSVAIKTMALNILLCHMGFFAFADTAELPLFGALHWVGEDLQSAEAGLSSFGAEVVRMQALLDDIDGGTFCFVALDEPARGTNPREGAALARALTRRLAGARSVSVIATHYDGVASVAQAHYQAAGLRDMPPEPPASDRLAFIARHMNYGLVRVASEAGAPRDALAVCRLLGLDARVVEEMERELGE